LPQTAGHPAPRAGVPDDPGAQVSAWCGCGGCVAAARPQRGALLGGVSSAARGCQCAGRVSMRHPARGQWLGTTLPQCKILGMGGKGTQAVCVRAGGCRS
jgi:hypothetical protein